MADPRTERRRARREWQRQWDALTPAEVSAFEELPFSQIPEPRDAVRVVAAVRPLIYREVAAELRTSEYLRDETDDHMGDIHAAADWLNRQADEMGATDE